jgi:hypothetical protein
VACRHHRNLSGTTASSRTWIESFGGHTHYHRPLSWYTDQLADHGLVVSQLHEPPTLPNHTRAADEWDDYERWFATIPAMIAISCRIVERA